MKKLLAVLLLVSNVVWSQNIDTTTGAVQTTPNAIDPNGWNNVIYMTGNQLGQVEGSGGGPVPAYNLDTNTIRFSYSPFTVSQVRAINQVLSGQGISVLGFNYSWKIYNDLENCCSTRGSLSVTGQLASPTGKVLESYYYDYSNLNTGANFLQISGTETFKSPYDLSSIGYIGIAWTGSDMNFWSGYYGPKVRDTSITLNYTVKQPSQPTVPSTTNTNTATDLALAASQPTVQEPTTTQTSTSTSAASATSESSTPTQSTAPVATSISTVTAIAPTVQIVQSSTPTQQTTNQSSAPSLSSVLSTIRNNEKKEQAIVSAAVAGANEVAQSAVQMTEQTAMSVATMSSTSSMQVMQQTNNTQQQLTTQSNNLSQGLPLANNSVAQNSNTANGQVSLLTPTEISSITIQPVTSQSLPTNTQSTMTDFRSAEAENTMFANNFLTNRANPLAEIVENNTKSNNSTTEQKDKPMNKTAQNNELAIGVSIDRMATQPTGYNSYLQLALTDASFYAPKEIYRNQRVIDNQRAVRLLNFASDAKHKEMTEQQYRR